MKRLIVIIVVLVALVVWFIMASLERQVYNNKQETAKEVTTYEVVEYKSLSNSVSECV